jgi:hypothetical protein
MNKYNIELSKEIFYGYYNQLTGCIIALEYQNNITAETRDYLFNLIKLMKVQYNTVCEMSEEESLPKQGK